MNILKERYITAVLEHVAEGQKDEVQAEVGSAIDEMVDQRVEAGEPEEHATEMALDELGDPVKLAASYQDRPHYLIGPGWYSLYISLLKRILVIVLPLITVISLLVAVGIEGKTLSGAIGGAVEGVLAGALQVAFWVTLGFAVVERVIGPEVPVKGDKGWTVAGLPEGRAIRQNHAR